MSQEPKILTATFDPRLYNLSKSVAISDSMTALNELVHNSLDNFADHPEWPNATIEIDYNLQTRSFDIRDNGTGVPPDKMVSCFATIGKRTSSDKARGYFARGAKDVSSLGSVIFTSFYNSKVSRLVFHRNSTYQYYPTVTPTPTHQFASGLSVRVEGIPQSQFSDQVELIHLGRFFSLRRSFGLLQKFTLNLVLVDGTRETVDVLQSWRQLVKAEAADELLWSHDLNTKFGSCRFDIYRLNDKAEALPMLPSEFRRHGVLVTSPKAAHELTGVHPDLMGHRMAKKIRGVLDCPFIDDLLEAFDGGAQETLIIDPSRAHGLNRKHPATRELFALVYRLLNYALDWLLQEEDGKVEDAVQLDMSSLLQDFPELAALGHTCKMYRGRQRAAAQLVHVQDRLSDRGGGLITPEQLEADLKHPEANGLSEVPGLSNIIVKLHNKGEALPPTDCPQHTWSLRGDQLRVDVDCSAAEIQLARRHNSLDLALAEVVADALVHFIQTQKISTASGNTKQEVLQEFREVQLQWKTRLVMAFFTRLKVSLLKELQ